MKNEECCASLSKREYASSLLSLLLHPFFICYCFLLFLLMKPAKLSIRYNRLPCFQKLDLIDGQHHVTNSANSLSRWLPWEQYEVLKWSLKDFVRILTHSLIVYCHGGSKLSVVDTAYARHNWSKLHSALALAQHSSFFILRSSFF